MTRHVHAWFRHPGTWDNTRSLALCQVMVVCFVCRLQDDQGIVTHYVGIQTDVSKAADMLHAPQALQEQQVAGAFGDKLLQPAIC
jgi:hypothetical protein